MPSQQTKLTLAAGLHANGCPAKRVEHFTATKPTGPDRPPSSVEVVRCIDCGGHDVRLAGAPADREGDET